MMFTGLVEQQGTVVSHHVGALANRLVIAVNLEAPEVGESIAINGVCLTLLPGSGRDAAFDVSPETLKLTNLGQLRVGDYVNIERAMLASARFGGHYVSGHVDTRATLLSVTPRGEYLEMVVGGFQPCDSLYLLPKGSITLDGVSLTINEVHAGCIHLLLIPHTLTHTTLGLHKAGDYLNVEFDYLTRVIAHQLRINNDKSF